MDELINIKLEELFKYLDNSSLVKEMKNLKNKIYNNQDLLNKINHIKTLNKYDPRYLELKLEIYKNEDYKKYIELEQKLNLVILNFNKKIKNLIGEKHESN